MNFEAPFETQESYVKESKTKIIWLSLTALFIICGILMAIFHPEAEFTWLVGSIKYYMGLFIIALICIYGWLSQLGEHRDKKYYFTPDGRLDLSTPRSYSKLKRPKLLELFNRGGLDEFAYDGEGNVHLVTSKGKTITAPLADLTVKYTMDKAGRDDWRIFKMTVTTPADEKIKFSTGSTMFPFPALMDAEYDDVHMILSTAGTLKESKTSKASKWADKIKSAYEDIDFSGFFGKSDKNSADNKVIGFVKAKVGVNQKKKSWFQKAMDHFWRTLGYIFIVIILILNISELPQIFRSVDNNQNEYRQELNNENANNSQDEVIPAENVVSAGPSKEFLEEADYEYFMCSFDETNKPFYLSIIPETGSGVYQAPSGNLYYLSIEEENNARTQFFCTATDSNGNSTKIEFYANVENYPDITGTMIGTDGSTVFDFTGSVVEIQE